MQRWNGWGDLATAYPISGATLELLEQLPGPASPVQDATLADVVTRVPPVRLPALYRAMLQGLTFALREGKEQIERRTKVPIRAIRMASGGSRSDAALQLTADIFGMPATRPHVYEASALGAAIAAAVGVRLHAPIPSAVQEMTHAGAVFDPGQRARTIYDELYDRVDRRMYRGLKPLYEELCQMRPPE